MTGWLLDVFVPGRPAPQGSKRYFGPKRSVEMSVHVEAWRDDVRAGCARAWTGREPLDGPLVLDVEFVRKRPASAPKRTTPPATTQPDLSKLVRSTEDAITSAGVWVDDARVVRLVASKRVAGIGETPGARIRVGRWAPEAVRPQIPSTGGVNGAVDAPTRENGLKAPESPAVPGVTQ